MDEQERRDIQDALRDTAQTPTPHLLHALHVHARVTHRSVDTASASSDESSDDDHDTILPSSDLLHSPTSLPPLLLKCLDPSHYRTMSWKNGNGRTHEIEIYPPTEDLMSDSFLWRLSTAEIKSTCSFSLFPEHMVHIILLSGGPHQLIHEGSSKSYSVKRLHPYSYSGHLATACTVEHEPSLDLTLLVHRQRASTKLAVEHLSESSNPLHKLLLSSFLIVYVVQGSVVVETPHLATNKVQKTVLHRAQTLIVERRDKTLASAISVAYQSADDAPFITEGNGNSPAIVVLIEISDEVPALTPSSSLIASGTGGLAGNNKSPVTVDMNTLNISTTPGTVTNVAPSIPLTPRRQGSLLFVEDQPLYVHSADDVEAGFQQSGPRHERAGSFSNLGQTMVYEPPEYAGRRLFDSDAPPPVIRDSLVIEDFACGQISTMWLNMMKDGLSDWIRMPVIVARGAAGSGPVVGITAAVHGNELNGVPCIHRLVHELDVSQLRGTVVCVPCVNTPGYLNFTREFSDKKDLNRLFPGDEKGTCSSIYAFHIMNKLVNHFNYLIDLHTASFGRVNSYYVRANLNDPVTAALARLQHPQIILHNSGQDGTLRSAAAVRGIKAITVEIGNPQLFQAQYIKWTFQGLVKILRHLDMLPAKLLSEAPPESEQVFSNASMDPIQPPNFKPVICSRGFWLYTRTGGVLEVYPPVNSYVRHGVLIARIKNIFGNTVDEIFAPVSGIIIGRSSNPVAMAGDRVVHIGVLRKRGEALPTVAKENY